MKITGAEIWTVVVPTIPGRVHSPEWVAETGWDQMPKQIVRLTTDTEYVGIGETDRGVSVEAVQAGLRLLLGRDPERLALQDIYHQPGDGANLQYSPGALAAYNALEIAVFDLVGRLRGLPVHALLGGAMRKRVRADFWMGHQTPEDGRRSVEWALARGFTGVKIKCRAEEPMRARLAAMLDVAGPGFKVTVDPNERFYTAAQTLALAAELEPLGNVEVFEDPIPKSDLDGYREIHASLPFPLAMHVADGAAALRGIQAGVVDCLNLGGSLVGFQRNAAVAAAAGLACWHGSGNDLGILDTAYIHAAAAAPNCTMASDFVGSWTREDDLIVEPILFAGGYTSTPMAPGLGCELDTDALARYTRAYVQVTA
jgi:muconate cycloisomerase